MSKLWTDFCNSKWHDWRGSGKSTDHLDNPAYLTKFLSSVQLSAPVPPGAAELEALKALRDRLRRLAQGLEAGTLPGPDDLQTLNAAMAAGPVYRQLTTLEQGYRLELHPAQPGWPAVMAEIAASFAQTLADGEASRVRICDNPDCLWVFCDDTRNRTKRFCDDKLCGNLMKVRRFRAKQKSGQ